jgi:hypothetical protein
MTCVSPGGRREPFDVAVIARAKDVPAGGILPGSVVSLALRRGALSK